MQTGLEKDLALYELQRLNTRVENAAADLHNRINAFDTQNRADHAKVVEQLGIIDRDLNGLKIQSSAWGVVGGAVAAAVAFTVQLFGWPTGHA